MKRQTVIAAGPLVPIGGPAARKSDDVVEQAILERVTEQQKKVRLAAESNLKYFTSHLALLDKIVKALKERIKAIEQWHFCFEEIIEEFADKAKTFSEVYKKHTLLKQHVELIRSKKEGEPQLFYRGTREALCSLQALEERHREKWQHIRDQLKEVIEAQLVCNSKQFKGKIEESYESMFRSRERSFSLIQRIGDRLAQPHIPIVELYQTSKGCELIEKELAGYGLFMEDFWTEITSQETLYTARVRIILAQMSVIYKELHKAEELCSLESLLASLDDSKACEVRMGLLNSLPPDVAPQVLGVLGLKASQLTFEEFSGFLRLKHAERYIYPMGELTRPLFLKIVDVEWDEGLFSKWRKCQLMISLAKVAYLFEGGSDQILDKMVIKTAEVSREDVTLYLSERQKGVLFDSRRTIKIKMAASSLAEEVEMLCR